MYSLDEVGKKLGLDRQTVQKLCEKGRFQDAHKTENGDWLIPDQNFITTREQDARAEEILRQIDRKNQEIDNDIEYVFDQVVASYYKVSREVVKNWIEQGFLSGKQSARNPENYLIPKEEFEYLKTRRESDTTEDELRKFLGEDYAVDLEIEFED